jgi:HK97 family phage prohead protease
MDFAQLVNQKGGGKKTFQTDVKQFESALFVKAVDIEKRQIRVLASNGDLDRDEERVLPQAFKNRLDIYKSNPVILASHQHRLDDGMPPVVGKAAEIWIDKTGLWCIIEFAKTKLAEEYWQLYSGGYMRAVSIGFSPIPGGYRDVNENGKMVREFIEVELYEISCVAVPANRAALSKSQQRKADWLTDKKILDDIKKQNPAFYKSCDEFAKMLLSDELDDADENSDSGDKFVLAKTVNPNGNYQENEFVRLATGR